MVESSCKILKTAGPGERGSSRVHYLYTQIQTWPLRLGPGNLESGNLTPCAACESIRGRCARVSLPRLSHRPQELTRPSPRPPQLSPCQNKAAADRAGPGGPAASGHPPTAGAGRPHLDVQRRDARVLGAGMERGGRDTGVLNPSSSARRAGLSPCQILLTPRAAGTAF